MSFLKGYSKTSSFQNLYYLTQHGRDKTKQLTDDEASTRIKLEKSKIELYTKLCKKVLEGNKKRIFNEEYYELVTKLLDWNHELYTAWNYRKELIINYKIKSINNISDEEKHQILVEELEFVLIKLKKSPKSYWIWNHRIWCLKLDKLSNWDLELYLIDKFLQADSRNFHVWSYRRLIINFMKSDNNIQNTNELIDFREFEFTTKMINKDISNYSAWHNRSKLIENLFLKSPTDEQIKETNLKEYLINFNSKDKTSFLKLELKLFQKAIYTDADDSSVWFYMKWLISDYFINDIEKDEIIIIINNLISDIKELNELEFEDNNIENKWCLISIIYLMKQLRHINNSDENDIEFNKILNKLKQIDPMRFERYKEFTCKV